MRPEILNPLFSNITSLKGVGDKTAGWISLLCGNRVLDLLFHLPSNIRTRSLYEKELPLMGQLVTFPFIPQKYILPSRRKLPFRVMGEAPFGQVELVFFHSHKGEIETRLPLEKTLWISGILQNKNGLFSMIHPDFIRGKKEDIPTCEVIYPLMAGARNVVLTKLIQTALSQLTELPEWQNKKWWESNDWKDFKTSLQDLHSPKSEMDLSPLSPFRQRLVYDELLANQLALMLVRQKNKNQSGISCPSQNTLKLNLPFSLTMAQQKVLSEISADLSTSARMSRLLQGDVGSGKTIVAILSALQVIENNYQVALMAPTDILARQHFQKISKLLEPLHIKTSLLTAREKVKSVT